jgi:hypothetical protein
MFLMFHSYTRLFADTYPKGDNEKPSFLWFYCIANFITKFPLIFRHIIVNQFAIWILSLNIEFFGILTAVLLPQLQHIAV